MTLSEFSSAVEMLKDIHLDPRKDIVTFMTEKYAWRGTICDAQGNHLVLMIKCIDAFDTSNAGNDVVAVPLSELVAIKHDAKKSRYERNKFADIAKSGLKGK